MEKITVKALFEAGAHFGHRTRYWSPKMAPYIYGARGGIHIINLEKTKPMIDDACNFLGTVAANGGQIMFVGTKRPARDAILRAGQACNMPYVNHRWLGGMLTNFKTIRQSIRKLHNMRKMDVDGTLERMTKKEAIGLRKEQEKMEASIGGIAEMKRLPDVLFIVDTGRESIAVAEAKTLGIPVVAIVDTNENPDNVDYIIPCNDDSFRAVDLCIDAVIESIQNAKNSQTVNKEELGAEEESTDVEAEKVAE